MNRAPPLIGVNDGSQHRFSTCLWCSSRSCSSRLADQDECFEDESAPSPRVSCTITTRNQVFRSRGHFSMQRRHFSLPLALVVISSSLGCVTTPSPFAGFEFASHRAPVTTSKGQPEARQPDVLSPALPPATLAGGHRTMFASSTRGSRGRAASSCSSFG